MREKEDVKPPSKKSAKDAFGNGAAIEKSFEEGLAQAVNKLSKQVDDLRPDQKENFETDKAAETVANKLGIEKGFIEDAYQSNSKELVKLSDAFVSADNRTEGFAVLGMLSGLGSFGSAFVAFMNYIHFDETTPVAVTLSVLGAVGSALSFRKAAQADSDKKQLTTEVRDRLSKRLEFVQGKQLPAPNKH